MAGSRLRREEEAERKVLSFEAAQSERLRGPRTPPSRWGGSSRLGARNLPEEGDLRRLLAEAVPVREQRSRVRQVEAAPGGEQKGLALRS